MRSLKCFQSDFQIIEIIDKDSEAFQSKKNVENSFSPWDNCFINRKMIN